MAESRRYGQCALAILMVFVCAAGARGQEAADPADAEIQTLVGQIAGSDRTDETRIEAAGLLLNRAEPRAREALLELLADTTKPASQKAVAEAVALHGGVDDAFVDPLLAILSGPQAELRPSAARALMTYKNHGVFERLLTMAAQTDTDKSVRLVLVLALQELLDKRAVDTLIQLLEDRDEDIRNAAAVALTELTGIRAFGADAGQWKQWWRRNKDKPPEVWLSDLADRLARARTDLEGQNRQLRTRLAQALGDLYLVTPQANRPALVRELLADPLADVRLAAVPLFDRLIVDPAGGDAAMDAEEIRRLLRPLLGDDSPAVRAAAAELAARLADPEMTSTLLARLAAEDDVVAKCGLLAALGQVGDPTALHAVLEELSGEQGRVAAAAARSLARISGKHALTEAERQIAVPALLDRYVISEQASNAAELREAILTAMGALSDPLFQPTLIRALDDQAATVRLAGVRALAQLANPQAAEALAPLVADDDRGVRRAAIAALGAIGGQPYLGDILDRTRGEVEADPDVRQQAWDVVIALLTETDPSAFQPVLDALAERDDATDRRIVVLQLLVERLAATTGDRLTEARWQLGRALMSASRPAEAAEHLSEVAVAWADAAHPSAREAWQVWVDALLASNDAAAAAVLADIEYDEMFDAALTRYVTRIQ